ncbi:glycosyltransferase family 2 protein [Halogeometricum sp. S1BR25-6]|uniref:Glycosyltransferase family 2 protein n=1 Tax=Halogeometricum salsisoli TaxID=2950536 RepID=A0ABU2GHM7_9EURY|nr:glycosyltransferase family 2 protein [Halogeometricum sp. S1BR25-6]MDS0300284.1 glycosyltransferase family 2 protein [Halogeometricum sp. S1BR25-6]
MTATDATPAAESDDDTDTHTDRPAVGIVVLTWENYEDTAECLRSLRSVEYPNYDVIVVDNGSTDGSGERLAAEFDWCTFVFNDENRGFAGGNNPGIERALSTGADYVLLLNNDTVVRPDFLAPLVETAEESDDVAAVGGVQYRYDTDEILNAGARFFPYLGGRVTTYRTVRNEDPYEVSYSPTSLILLDRTFIEENDILHDGYFLGMEDVDLAVQARQRGKRVVINPDSMIKHKEGLTQERSPFMVYHWMRNRLQFASQRLSVSQRTIFYSMFVLTIVQFSLFWIVRGQTDLLRSTYVGVTDHFAEKPFRPYESFE